MTQTQDKTADRQGWISLLATCDAADLDGVWQDLDPAFDHQVLRAPEIGSVMVRGRAGAVGAAFNLGEITVTRCSVRLSTGEDGHAYVQGRDRTKALRAALLDAAMQTAAAAGIREKVLGPLSEKARQRRATRAAKAAATKVDFFTMARGED
ncbi:Alpha-D-ribose 1-methylphosphonate 5-triphosphate synthase subunit PhnG [Sulfitobacter sp. THAF37]|uniref:phosphonate C-P lyase system protein PhnG n=1 Tax=Sulfitobacter sp. THAF37 TaxID=2587855 RepID=UPI0012696028|nr:phosphonate C-P lyase system protein PhnG [Sulfitobacter sp. THAF37]QFT58842.1 Alpha-D-ribose 1-methylphosphonate 5-triphosphate synthase subunit PhnG [Sulfitobacter sp. THAF37]